MIDGGKSQQNVNAMGNGKREGGWIPAVNWRKVILALVLLVVALLLGAVLSLLEPPVTCRTLRQVQARPDETFSFMDDQVIVTGPASAFRDWRQFGDVRRRLELVLIRTCDLSYLDAPLGLWSARRGPPPHLGAARGKLITRLYHIRGGGSVPEVVNGINKVFSDTHLYADPNLLTGHSVCGNPEHTGGGSPFGGIPRLLSVGDEAAVKAFWEQWALQRVDAGWSLKEELAGAAIRHQGEGVLVGVFDTAPFPDPWDGVGKVEKVGKGEKVPTIDTQEAVKWVNPTMDVQPLRLTVSYPQMLSTVAATDTITMTTGITEVGDVRDHGLFVAGLVHAVAPASEIRLIRVLNEIGCGDLFTLNEALARFIGEVEAERRPCILRTVLRRLTGQEEEERKPLSGVVINLSLGVRESQSLGILARTAPTDTCRVGNVRGEIVSLCETLHDAHEMGAVIVAAAGNEHNGEGEPPPAQLPAAYDFVFAAEASNGKGERACFSNQGDVRAPGGDGGSVGKDLCASTVHTCPADYSAECPNGVISLVLFPPNGNAYWPTHYGYWSGTSFSAPLVSGLAALVLEADGVQSGAGGVEPQEISNQGLVTDTILCGAAAAEPKGVINVTATLTDCLH